MTEANIIIENADSHIAGKALKIVKIIGQLDESNVDEKIQIVYKLIEQTPTNLNLILDLEGLEYMNSKSIGYLTDIYGKIADNNGKVVIAKARPNIIDILQLVGLTQLIPFFDSIEQARGGLSDSSQAPIMSTPAAPQIEQPAAATPAPQIQAQVTAVTPTPQYAQSAPIIQTPVATPQPEYTAQPIPAQTINSTPAPTPAPLITEMITPQPIQPAPLPQQVPTPVITDINQPTTPIQNIQTANPAITTPVQPTEMAPSPLNTITPTQPPAIVAPQINIVPTAPAPQPTAAIPQMPTPSTPNFTIATPEPPTIQAATPIIQTPAQINQTNNTAPTQPTENTQTPGTYNL